MFRLAHQPTLRDVLLTTLALLTPGCGAPVATPSTAESRNSETESAAPHSPNPETQTRAPAAPPSDAPPLPAGTGGTHAQAPSAPTESAGASLRPTQFVEELRALKLDPAALPEMSQLDAIQRYKLMPLLTQSLGKECEDCHQGEDYEAETPAKELTRKMWNEMVRPFALAEGPVFCDSCHQGSHKNLKREADVMAYMKKEYAGRLLSKGKPVDCTACHVDSFEAELFESIWP